MTIVFSLFGILMIAVILYAIFGGTKPHEFADLQSESIKKILLSKKKSV